MQALNLASVLTGCRADPGQIRLCTGTPADYDYASSGTAFEEKKSRATSTATFAFGLIIVFLLLAAQFESWTLPGSVMTVVPFGILGALAFNWLRGLHNDVHFQIGLLVLIGLGAKNAVLRVTFAV
jgi:multidrug efflux pump